MGIDGSLSSTLIFSEDSALFFMGPCPRGRTCVLYVTADYRMWRCIHSSSCLGASDVHFTQRMETFIYNIVNRIVPDDMVNALQYYLRRPDV